MLSALTEQTRKATAAGKEIAVVTCCIEDWGGSEELWARSLPFFQADGYNITVYKSNINRSHSEWVKLAGSGVRLEDINPVPKSRLTRISKKVTRKLLPGRNKSHVEKPEDVFAEKLKLRVPDIVIIGQGINFDGAYYAEKCHNLGIKYVMVSQKAVDFYWPYYTDRDVVIKVYKHAAHSVFVCRHNLRLTEEQLGMKIPRASVVFNPVKFSRKVIPYPSAEKGYQLACIGRYFLLDKGQDVLIRILSGNRWRNLPVTINFIGAGHDKTALKEMAEFLQVKNVSFPGHSSNMDDVWREHHALILPSRSEGMPLVVLEAMAAGRPVIVSNAGGNTEIVEEGVTGFIGAPFEESFEQAMERAWEKRDQWKNMGEKASAHISVTVPDSPELEFANQIKLAIHA